MSDIEGAVESDDEFVARLSAVVDSDLDEVPHDLSDFARAAQAWSVVDEQLAELVETDAATVRSTDSVTTAVFDLLSREIAVTLRGDLLVGHISPFDEEPMVDASVEVETLEGRQPVELDDLGRFRMTDVHLPFRVRIAASAEHSGVTPWVTH